MISIDFTSKSKPHPINDLGMCDAQAALQCSAPCGPVRGQLANEPGEVSHFSVKEIPWKTSFEAETHHIFQKHANMQKFGSGMLFGIHYAMCDVPWQVSGLAFSFDLP